MSHKRLTRPVVMVLAATGSAALMTGGIAEAEGWGQNTSPAHSHLGLSAAGGTAPGRCAAPKKAPSGGRPVSVDGHRVRVLFPRHQRSTAPGHKKQSPAAGTRVSVNGHTVRLTPAGHPATRAC